jgi:hypothetical protein
MYKVLPLTLELCLGGLQVHLSSAQAVRLLLKVGCAAVGTLVWWCEPGLLLRLNLVVDVVAHARRIVVVDVVGVILRAVPRENLEEGAERGDVGPRRAGEDGAPWCLAIDEVLQL